MAGRGSAPGERRGGKQKGTPNRATTERLEQERIARQAQAEVNKAYASKVKLGKEVLEDYMMAFHAVAATYQNKIAASLQRQAEPGKEDLASFKEWGGMVVETARRLAEFQSPKFKAIAVVAPPPNAHAPKPIEGNVVPLNDPIAISRVYSNLIRAVR